MNKKPNTKVCLLGASFATNNMGVGALAAGAIKCILHSYPGAEISLLDYGKESLQYDVSVNGRSVRVRLLNTRFSKKFYLKNNIARLLLVALLAKVIPFRNMRRRIIAKNEYLDYLSQADIVAAISGGDSFSDIYGLRRLLYIALPQLLILFLGKELFLLPQTVGPFESRIAKRIAKYILQHASVTYTRDLVEQKMLKQSFDLNGRLRFCYDIGFALDPVAPAKMDVGDLLQKKDEKNFVIGLNISGLLYMGGYTKNNMFRLKTDYRELVYDTIGLLMKKPDVVVLLVPHVFGSPDHAESDSVVCEKIHGELKEQYKDRLFLAKGNYNQNEIKYIIGLCDFFIGSRMHACIAALSQGIPAVAIAYSKKFLGVMHTIGAESLIADPRTMNKKEIMTSIEYAYAQQHVYRKQLQSAMPRVKQRVLNLFDEITQ